MKQILQHKRRLAQLKAMPATTLWITQLVAAAVVVIKGVCASVAAIVVSTAEEKNQQNNNPHTAIVATVKHKCLPP